jgi:hypothetical protein
MKIAKFWNQEQQQKKAASDAEESAKAVNKGLLPMKK